MMGHNHCLRKFAYLILATGSLCVETVAAQTLPSPIAVITTLPPPAPQIAFSTSLRDMGKVYRPTSLRSR